MSMVLRPLATPMDTLRAFTVRVLPAYFNTASWASYRRISSACCASSRRTNRIHLASSRFIGLLSIELSTRSHSMSCMYICSPFSSPHGLEQ